MRGNYLIRFLLMDKVNLFDEEFRHSATPDGHYSVSGYKKCSKFQYVRDNQKWDGVTLFTDRYLLNGKDVNVDSKYKIGWMIETKETCPETHQQIDDIIKRFDFIITYDDEVLKKYPNKTRFYPYAGCWVFEENYGTHPKSKLVSMLYSHKSQASGHRLRHQIVRQLKTHVDLFGSGAGKPFDRKEDILKPYMFTIVIENSKSDYYFSEKLLDAMSLGVIPIYWGANKINEFFDINGIITFNTVEELNDILSKLTEKDYYDRMDSIKNNLKTLEKYHIPEDWIYDNILKKEGLL